MQDVSKKSRHLASQTAEIPVGTGFLEKVNIKRRVEQKRPASVCSQGSYNHLAAAALNILMFHLLFKKPFPQELVTQ